MQRLSEKHAGLAFCYYQRPRDPSRQDRSCTGVVWNCSRAPSYNTTKARMRFSVHPVPLAGAPRHYRYQLWSRSEQRSRCSYGFEQKNNSGANCADCDRLLIHKAGLTVKFQSSWMDRHDRRTGHNVLDLQDRQRGVQLSEGREVVEDRFNRGIDQLIGLIAG